MTALFVASNGGHLAQLYELAGRMKSLGEQRWVSFDNTQARALLDGKNTVFIPYIAERDVVGVVRSLGHAHQIIGETPSLTAVLSTGSAIALSFLPYAALRGIEAHYIESAARVGQPSLTGRVLQRIPGLHLYRQYPHVAGKHWKYGGSVFDGFKAVREKAKTVKRVVVTVGTDRGFRRLIQAAARILPDNIEVLWQTGHTQIEGLRVDAHPFVPTSVLQKAVHDADAIIAHAGCGSALMALRAQKCAVLIPRDPSHGEVVDLHQIEIARWLAERGLAIMRTPDELTFEDLEASAEHSVWRQSDLPPFQLTTMG